jgi:hypothetical protein
MANPTGTTYLIANLFYSWTDGDVYEIPQTDTVEGAATGASFGGLGVDNQPHQVLLNKVQYTRMKQLADEENMAALQTWEGLFTSTVGQSGWYKVGVQDSNRGQISIIEQWGIGQIPSGGSLVFALPIAFPNAAWAITATVQAASGSSGYWVATAGFQGLGNAQVIVWDAIHNVGVNGAVFYWRAVGY